MKVYFSEVKKDSQIIGVGVYVPSNKDYSKSLRFPEEKVGSLDYLLGVMYGISQQLDELGPYELFVWGADSLNLFERLSAFKSGCKNRRVIVDVQILVQKSLDVKSISLVNMMVCTGQKLDFSDPIQKALAIEEALHFAQNAEEIALSVQKYKEEVSYRRSAFKLKELLPHKEKYEEGLKNPELDEKTRYRYNKRMAKIESLSKVVEGKDFSDSKFVFKKMP